MIGEYSVTLSLSRYIYIYIKKKQHSAVAKRRFFFSKKKKNKSIFLNVNQAYSQFFFNAIFRKYRGLLEEICSFSVTMKEFSLR